MTGFKKSVLIIGAIVGTGLFVRHHHHGSPPPSETDRIVLTQQSVDILLLVGMSDWRREHHATCEQTVAKFHEVFATWSDGWRHHYRGSCPKSVMTVTSAGPDGVFDTDDDISNFRRW